MVFVTVGNATQPFLRLLESVDQLAGVGMFESEQVLLQTGNNTSFQPKHCNKQPFLAQEEFDCLIKQATLIIAHAGAGTLLAALGAGKLPVVMPRRRHYGEILDDHQVELTQILASEGRVVSAWEPDDLPQAILKARQHKFTKARAQRIQMTELVEEAIAELLK